MKHFARGELYVAYGLAFAAAFYPSRLLAHWLARHGWDLRVVLLLRLLFVLAACEGLARLLEPVLRRLSWIIRVARRRHGAKPDERDL